MGPSLPCSNANSQGTLQRRVLQLAGGPAGILSARVDQTRIFKRRLREDFTKEALPAISAIIQEAAERDARINSAVRFAVLGLDPAELPASYRMPVRTAHTAKFKPIRPHL